MLFTEIGEPVGPARRGPTGDVSPEVIRSPGTPASCCARVRPGPAGQHSHARSERYRTAGFRYHPEHDAWVCPQDQMLWPTLYDRDSADVPGQTVRLQRLPGQGRLKT